MPCPLPLLSSPLLHLSQADHPRVATSKPLVEQILQAPTSAFLRSGLQPGTTQLRRRGAAPKLQNLISKQTLTNQGSTPSHIACKTQTCLPGAEGTFLGGVRKARLPSASSL